MKTARIWLSILSPALLFLTARLLLTTCMEALCGGGQAKELSSCLLLLPVVFCYFRFDRSGCRFAPVRPVLPWLGLTGALLVINAAMPGYGIPVPSPTVLGVLGSAVCAPISEELIYRGLVSSRSEEYLGVRAALLISSALFGIAHTGLLPMAWAAGFGAVLYLMRRKFRTILAPIATHILLNLAAFVL